MNPEKKLWLGDRTKDRLDRSAWAQLPSPTLGRETETAACRALPNQFLLKDYLLTAGRQLPTQEPDTVGILRVGAGSAQLVGRAARLLGSEHKGSQLTVLNRLEA